VERERIFSNTAALAVQLMLLCHPPVSQRFFFFFNFQHIGTDTDVKRYLRSDFTMERNGDRWAAFLPMVIFVGTCFTVGLPLLIFILLMLNRKRLHTPKVKNLYGFLYNRYSPGSELWEVHEIIRKTVLCGGLCFLDKSTRTGAAILICVLAVASLNYLRPQRNHLVFCVAEAAFLGTTAKYLGAVILSAQHNACTDNNGTNNGTTTGNTECSDEQLGYLLVSLDLIVMGFGITAVSMLLVNIRREVTSTDQAAVKVKPTSANDGAKEGKIKLIKVQPAGMKNSSGEPTTSKVSVLPRLATTRGEVSD
jgi:hypothetical protein